VLLAPHGLLLTSHGSCGRHWSSALAQYDERSTEPSARSTRYAARTEGTALPAESALDPLLAFVL
jgi:hypothetical protein